MSHLKQLAWRWLLLATAVCAALPACAEKRCYLFDGSTDTIDLSAALSVSGDFAVSAWVNLEALAEAEGGARTIFGNQSGHTEIFRIQFYGDPITSLEFYGEIADSPTFSSATYTDELAAGTWHNLIWQRVDTSGTPSMECYVDGSLWSTDTTAVPTGTWAPNRIGAAATIREWWGKLFDVRIYDDDLTAGEISTIQAFGTPGTVNLTHWWKMNDTNATTMPADVGSITGTKSVTDPPFHYLGADVPHDYDAAAVPITVQLLEYGP